jgi:hypothetical protein
MRLVNPWPDGRTIRSPFGYRTHPITGRRKLHRGVDVGGQFPVHAPAAGVVAHIGWSPRGGGHTVIIDHGTIHTVYYHLRERTVLNRGDRVDVGTFIGTSGTTGMSTGNHLHFEVRTGRAWGTQVDPVPYLTGNNVGAVPHLRVNGRLNRSTWRTWQTQLATAGHYRGRIDGIPGRMTNTAIQSSTGVKADGIMGPVSRRSVQLKLKAWGYYDGRIDGVWGRITVTGIQRSLNDGRWDD